MRASTLPRYLLGSRAAIAEIAQSPWSILYGVVFVLSAGLAREYDGHDLVHEPWHLLRPFAASLLAGTLLFLLVHVIASIRVSAEERCWPVPAQAWRVFLSLFWMTAPLAWMYAIPYERFLTPVGAVEANLWTLAVVAAWRVVLITRVISVLYHVNPIATFFIVMVFADAVAFTAMQIAAVPVIDLMGGIRYTAEERLIADAAFQVTILSVYSAPVWIVGGLCSIAFFRPQWLGNSDFEAPRHHSGLAITALSSLLILIGACALTQPEQVRKREAERLLRDGRVTDALESMSRFRRDDFPLHWDPLPRLGRRGDGTPDLEAVLQAMQQQWPAEWVARIYLDKMHQAMLQAVHPWSHQAGWTEVVPEDRGNLDAYVLDQIAARREMIVFLREHDSTLSTEERNAIDFLLGGAAEHLESDR